MTENNGTNNNGTENNSEGKNNGSTTNNGNEQRNTDFSHLSREDVEKALREARDDAGKYRTRAKEFADDETYNRAVEAVKKLDEIEQVNKSEVEKLSEKNAKLLTDATANELALKKYRAAMAAGIDPSQVDEFANRLRGETDEEIKADAEKLAKFFKPNGSKQGDHSQGKGNEGSGSADDNPLMAALQKL